MKVINRAARTAALMAAGLTGALVGALPSEAATLASSSASFIFTNFSQSPTATQTDTLSDSQSIGSTVITDSDASALAATIPSFALNDTFGEVIGSGTLYSGTAEAEAEVIAEFDLTSNSLFSFNFTAVLELVTSIDLPGLEQAEALGELDFALFGR
ncbi:MAG: hypothetical protein F6J97_15060, partial [Leptolyngbya sp. SIO4C1]|nr:hypothetical protein [Leptolyngbya sp. SIO4C1]